MTSNSSYPWNVLILPSSVSAESTDPRNILGARRTDEILVIVRISSPFRAILCQTGSPLVGHNAIPSIAMLAYLKHFLLQKSDPIYPRKDDLTGESWDNASSTESAQALHAV